MGQEQVQIATVTIQDLSGGINSNTLSTSIEDRDATDASNVYYFDGFLRKIFGAPRVNTMIGGFGATDKINGIHDFQLRDGTQQLVVVTESDIFRRNGTNWTSIVGALVVSDARHQLITFNDSTIGTNLDDAPWAWPGAGNAAALGGGPPSAKWITVFQNRVILANANVGGSLFPARAYYSAVDDATSWDTTNRVWDFEIDDGDELTGVLPLRQSLVFYKRNSISLLSWDGYSTPVIDHQYKKGVGCVSGYTVKHARIFINEIMREGHIFLGEDGLFFFDGSEVTRLSDKAKDFLKSQNTQRFSEAVAEFYKPLDQYCLFFTSSGETANDSGLIYDTRRGGIWPIDGFRANAVALVENSSTGIEDLLFGSYDSLVYQLSESNNGLEQETELVTNGSMELDANWTDFGSPSTEERSGAQFFNGSFSRHVITDAVLEGTYQDITTVVGAHYRITAAVRPESGEVRIAKQDTDGTDATNGTTISTLAAWTVTTVDFIATSTTSRIIAQCVSTAASEFYVDDVSVRRIDYTGLWDSKWFDLGHPQEVKILRELIVYALAAGDHNLEVRVRTDFSTGSGSSGNLNLLQSGGAYGSGLYDTAVYGGASQLFDDIDSLAQNGFTHIQVRFRNQNGNEPFQVEKFVIDAKPIGRRFLHNAT